MPDAAPPPSPRLFLVDGYALIYRAFFALISRPLTTSKGENTSAAWGIANFLQRLITTHKPDYLGWVHDSGSSFRTERYPEYKATREKLSEELQSDFDRGMERIAELLAAYRIPIIRKQGYEADDVIGSLVGRGVAAGVNVIVVSGDKDFQQLVQPGVWLLNPGRGGPASVEEQWVSVENASERLGVPPERVVDYLALVGDTSDNVPGVKGIGEKGAQELIAEFGALEDILANVEKITKKRPREALAEQADNARLSKELVTILRDLDVELDLERLRMEPPDNARLKRLFVELEFTSLARQVEAPPAEAAVRDATRYELVDSVQAMTRLVARARKARHFALDTETVADADAPTKVDPLRSTLVGISIALAPGEAYYLPIAHRRWEPAQAGLFDLDAAPELDPPATDATDATDAGDVSAATDATDGDEPAPAGAATRKPRKKAAAKPAGPSLPDSLAGRAIAAGAAPARNLPPLGSAEMRPLVELLEDEAVRKTLQNAKYDMLVFRRAGVRLRGVDFDTMIASYVIDPGRRSHGLDNLALELLGHQMISYEEVCGRGRQQLGFDVVPAEVARDYAAEDADYTLRLRALFEPQLAETGGAALFRDVEIPLVQVLADMESAGVEIDLPWFRSLKARFAAERARVEREIYAEAGEEFNINSNPKLRQVLFEKLGLPARKRTSTGPSTDASVLQELADEGHVIPQLLMEYREIFKLEGTYIDTLPSLVHPGTARLHTSFNQTVASTGRLSSSDPNLQNIPIRRELGRDIRRGFIPRKGWVLLAADYSQIELRLLAHLSHDPAFVEAFRSGGDIHVQTAAVIFGVPVDQVTKEMRGRAKTINFATIYGQGPHALSRQLRIAQSEAKAFIATYFERFAGIKAYLDGQVEFAREHGYVQTIFGRRRYVPELRDRNFNVRAFGERVAQNAPIQGSAADLIKIAMIRIAERLQRPGVSARMLLQVHDELVFEVPAPELDAVRDMVVGEMEGAATLDVPLLVEVGTGANWLETKL